MKELFEDLRKIEGVKGVLLLSLDGHILFKDFLSSPPDGLESADWQSLLNSLGDVREADLVFETGRLYIRKAHQGFIIVWVGLFASMAMLRLSCDIILPALIPAKSSKRFKRFFKKK